MPHFGFIGQGKQILIDVMTAQTGHRQGRDKFGAGFGQYGFDLAAFLADGTDQFQAFIGGDAATDDQQNFFTFKTHGLKPYRCRYDIKPSRPKQGQTDHEGNGP